jgi:oligopeptide transport system substrate-binding protein
MPAQKSAVESFGNDYALEANKMVYSGPFIVEEWKHEEELILVKNPNYWDADTVRLDKIIGYMIVDDNTMVQMYEADELDHITVPPVFINKFIGSPEYKSLAEASTNYLMFNSSGKYFSNPKMRLAFALATDAETYVNVVENGLGLVAEGYTPSTLAGKGHSFAEDRKSTLPGYNPEEAAMIFEEALKEIGATKEEFQNEVSIIAGEGDYWSRITQFFQSQWKENLGVELFIEQLSHKMRLERCFTGNYEITYMGWGGDYNDPLTFLGMLATDNGNNITFWSNAQYDAAIQIAINGEGYERIDAMVDAEAIIAEELPIYPLFHKNKNIAVKPYVKGLGIYPVGSDYDFKWTYIEK